jgi:hypothetical protein
MVEPSLNHAESAAPPNGDRGAHSDWKDEGAA